MKKPVSYCQSCGMPFDKAHLEYIAKEADGSDSIYCTYCYRDGEFLHPNATAEDMIEMGVPHLAFKIGEQAARKQLSEFVPALARWKNAELLNKQQKTIKRREKMANLKGTRTEKNLLEAFAGESQARNKYTYFASKAKKEGYEQIGAFFEETAGNEKEHAKIWFKLICGGDVPATAENLKAAAAGEHEEWTRMYKRMAAEAREEGFKDIALLFESVGKIEKEHEKRYLKLLKNVQEKSVFAKKKKSVWICRNCGQIVDGENAPAKCPVCAHPQSHFELRVINY